MKRSAGYGAVLTCLTIASAAVTTRSQNATQNVTGEWRHYAATAGSSKYSPLDQINAATVKNLRIAWRQSAVPLEMRKGRSAVPLPVNWQVTPIMADGLLYTSTGDSGVAALDPTTGRVVWFYLPPNVVDSQARSRQENAGRGSGAVPDASGQTKEVLSGQGPNRGVAYWTDGKQARIIAMSGSRLVALEAKTGKLVPGFGTDGVVNLLMGYDRLEGKPADSFRWTSLPLIVRDVIVVAGTPNVDGRPLPGDVRAFDVRTGKQLWIFHAVPRPGEFGVETWLEESHTFASQAGAWGLLSADEELGYIYVPHEQPGPATDFYGGHRPGNNLFGNSLVCLDAATGRRVWHFQGVHHDLWDWDFNAAPILADITVGGKRIKAVAQVSKQAYVYVFDRITGDPVWPIEERPAPKGDVPREWYAPTQPHPTKPPAFDQQGVTVDDLIDFTPELRREALDIIRKYRYGALFTPPSVAGGPDGKQGTLQVPGTVSNVFNGAGFDPETGMLYVPSVGSAVIVELIPNDGTRFPDRRVAYVHRRFEGPIGGAMIGAWAVGPRGLPLFKPPYGRLTAIDLNKGDIVWQVPNGDGPRDHPAIKHLNLPPLGQPGRAAPLVTKSMVFLGEGGNAGILALPPYGGGKTFRAYDKATGEVIWEMELPGGTNGAPMTYLAAGKQYIVVAVGWEGIGGELVALSLP
jgi:quinoprotein glucose dehydrogenase